MKNGTDINERDSYCRPAYALIASVDIITLSLLYKHFWFVVAFAITVFVILGIIIWDGRQKGFEFKFKLRMIPRLFKYTIFAWGTTWYSLLFMFFNIKVFYKLGILFIALSALMLVSLCGYTADFLVSLLNFLGIQVNSLIATPRNIGYTLTGLGIIILSLIFLLPFHPFKKRYKKENARKVVISGISPFTDRHQKLADSNIIPLISILEQVKPEEECLMLILLTDKWQNEQYKRPYVELKDGSSASLGEFTDDITKGEKGRKEKIEEDICKVIKKAAKLTYNTPNMEGYKDDSWYDNNLQIVFSKPADYNTFSDCYKKLSKAIKKNKIDDTNDYVYLNISPGTAVVSSVITLFGIDADRNIYYYTQNKIAEEPKIVEIDKKIVHVENLLSQALQNSY